MNNLSLQAYAFVKGVLFDNVIASYIIVAPLTIAFTAGLFNCFNRILYKTLSVFLILLYAIVFAITASNLSYFPYFFKNINASIFNWLTDRNTVINMILEEKAYWSSIIMFIMATFFFTWVIRKSQKRLFKAFEQVDRRRRLYPRKWASVLFSQIPVVLLTTGSIGATILGIRGSFDHNPIRVSQAYYCEDPLLNQLGINPAFNLMITTADTKRAFNRNVSLMNSEEAALKAKQYMNDLRSTQKDAPFRKLMRKGNSDKPVNVVMVMMESMSANLMSTFGQTKTLTPFLDSLYQESLHFPHFYSSGIHTNQGLFSTLTSYPAVLVQHMTKNSDTKKVGGLATTLRKVNYNTLFFMTHEAKFDNMSAFLFTNGFQEVFSVEDYPKEKVVSRLGIADDYLYEYAVAVFNRKHEEQKPFFAMLMSITNHPPYILPKDYTFRNSEKEDQVVEFSDNALRDLMKRAQAEPWYDNTVFVFLADHGKKVGIPETEVPESYNHVPLMIYSPLLEKGECNGFAAQIDVAPTILGLLDIEDETDHFGIDLMRFERPCIYYSAGHMTVCRDREHMVINVPTEERSFYYEIDSVGKFKKVASQKDSFFSLSDYNFSFLQRSYDLIESESNRVYNKPDAL